MMRTYNISIAIATYNGEKYIKEQLESILIQLKRNDEIIISDDGSKDKTLEIIKSYNDNRIKVYEGPQKGIKKNFENAINHCKGKYIFLSDQDDIWKKNKVKKVLNVFEKEKCTCVTHNCIVFDNVTSKTIYESFFDYRNSGKGIIKNIWKNTYIGCCMAFESNIINKILPIPDNIEMHDQWIGIISEKYGKSIFIKEKLLLYRRHEYNYSKMKPYSIKKRIKNRIILIINVLRR